MRNEKRNVGVEKATEAAAAVRGKLVIPPDPGDINNFWLDNEDDDVARLLESGQVVPASESTSIDDPEALHTDLGFAKLFARTFADEVCFLEDLNAWAIRGDNGHWQSADGAITERVKRCGLVLFDRAKNCESRSMQEQTAKFAIRCQSVRAIRACRELAKSDPLIVRNQSDFVGLPGLLPVQNGVVDLVTGKLRPAGSSDMYLKIAPIVFDPNAKCPNWLKFVKRVQPNRKMRRYLRKVLGIILSGNSEIEVFFFIHGPGASGKSTWIRVMMALLGDLARKFPVDALLKNRRGSSEHELQPCIGARAAVAGEMPANAEFDDSKAKDHASSDMLGTRPLYGHRTDFRRSHFLICFGNHQPKVPTKSDSGFWRRMHLIPFDEVIPGSERDTDFFEKKLRDELPGILNWAIKGYQLAIKEGIDAPSPHYS